MSTTSDRPARAKRVSHRQAAQLLAEQEPVIAGLVEQIGLPTFAAPKDLHFAALVRRCTSGPFPQDLLGIRLPH